MKRVRKGTFDYAEFDVSSLRNRHWLTRVVFLRCLGFVYMVAFVVALNSNGALVRVRTGCAAVLANSPSNLGTSVIYQYRLQGHYKCSFVRVALAHNNSERRSRFCGHRTPVAKTFRRSLPFPQIKTRQMPSSNAVFSSTSSGARC